MTQRWPIFFSVFAQVDVFFTSSQCRRSYPQENSEQFSNYFNISSKLYQGKQIPGCFIKLPLVMEFSSRSKVKCLLPEARSNPFYCIHIFRVFLFSCDSAYCSDGRLDAIFLSPEEQNRGPGPQREPGENSLRDKLVGEKIGRSDPGGFQGRQHLTWAPGPQDSGSR